MNKITSFSGEHEFLSNFCSSPITVDGIEFPTVEHAFQAAKTFDLTEKHQVAMQTTPGKAKRLGRKVTLRPHWNEIRAEVMEALVHQKFFEHPDLAAKLLATGDDELVEGNTWNDTFYGVCRGKGQNRLGQILMKVRDGLEMRKEFDEALIDELRAFVANKGEIMVVKVEQCSSGQHLYFRMTWGDGHWQHLKRDTWNRKTASEALDLLETVYGLSRRNIKFEHR